MSSVVSKLSAIPSESLSVSLKSYVPSESVSSVVSTLSAMPSESESVSLKSYVPSV